MRDRIFFEQKSQLFQLFHNRIVGVTVVDTSIILDLIGIVTRLIKRFCLIEFIF